MKGTVNERVGIVCCGYCSPCPLGSLGNGEYPMTEIDPTTVEIDLEIHDITQSTEVE